MNEKEMGMPHTLFMENRKNITLTGVKEIISFDDECVSLITVMGKAVIRGKDIRIENFGTESGDMEIEGKFDAVVYLNESSSKGGVLGRLFK